MLQPKRTKFRKQFKGRNPGLAQRGNNVSFGEFGLKATSRARMTAREIEAARRAMARYVKRGGLLAQLLDVLALLADDDAGPRGLDGDVDLLGGALDQNAAHRGLGELLLEELPHPEVGVHVHRELLLAGIPARGPVAHYPESDAQRIDLLTHALVLLGRARR
ncbi:MAG: hypothetical protein E6K38_11665 [Gammaproteobacteria bacterium]|nr:MAG: hypothetical protein E6K38_11665 [Gammaproteobacteria bacterium]